MPTEPVTESNLKGFKIFVFAKSDFIGSNEFQSTIESGAEVFSVLWHLGVYNGPNFPHPNSMRH